MDNDIKLEVFSRAYTNKPLSSLMKVTLGTAALSCYLGIAQAHTLVWGLWLNGEFQGDGRSTYVRSPPNNDPIKDLTSDALTCNVRNNPVPDTVKIASGDVLTFEWYHDNRDDDIIDFSHHGPVQVYIAPTDSNGSGPVWTKIYSDSYDTQTASWATDRLINAHGQQSIIVPDIPAGKYLFRGEIVALHEADSNYVINPIRGAQFYMSCSQVEVTTDGPHVPPGGTSFPGSYDEDTPGVVWNLYWATDPADYVAPGPDVWEHALGGWISQVGEAFPKAPEEPSEPEESEPVPSPEPVPEPTEPVPAPSEPEPVPELASKPKPKSSPKHN